MIFSAGRYIDTGKDFNNCTVLVPGARVYESGVISDIYSDRLRTGAEAFERFHADRIIVSGDNRDSHNRETTRGKNFLAGKGIPAERIYEDASGFTTMDSMRNLRGKLHGKLVIVTQSYHLYRAVYIARALGFDAYGISSDRQTYRAITLFRFREIFARVKSFLMITFMSGAM
jgi:vancomycin permeability regulator SanA